MRSNGVIHTLLKDSRLHPKPYLSAAAAAAHFHSSRFYNSSSRSTKTASLPLKYLKAYNSHRHFHCNTFAIINRANFLIVINNGVEDSIIEPHIKLLSLNWLPWMYQLRLLSRTTERSMRSLHNLAGEQLWNGLIRVISNERCESDTPSSVDLIHLIVKMWISISELKHNPSIALPVAVCGSCIQRCWRDAIIVSFI